MKISRRLFLKAAPAYGLMPFITSNASHDKPSISPTLSLNKKNWLPEDTVFQHGIASGDPLADAIILWTRVTPINIKNITERDSVLVKYEISTDINFSTIEQSGDLFTNRDRDFTVKFDVTGLASQQIYYYRFIFQYENYYSISDIGRTKTLPSGHVKQVTMAMTSCSHYGYGYFNVYARMAEMKDIDFFLHLGDYLYEYGNYDHYRNPLLWQRKVLPNHEMVTLEDYRLRHATYKTDKDLQRLHKTHPMIAIWDDHEFTNDAWRHGAQNHNRGEGNWQDRAKAAVQAYYEWMPIREPSGNSEDPSLREKSYRQFRLGDLINLTMLDTRYIGRDKQLDFSDPELYREQRTLLGAEQEAWLENQLLSSHRENVCWNLIGQQVQVMQYKLPGRPIDFKTNFVNNDSWDGYPAARRRLLNFIRRERINNIIFLTGDVHSSWAADITPDPYNIFKFNPITQEGAMAVELVTPSVTSPYIPIPGVQQIVGDIYQLSRLFNPHIRYLDTKNRGFVKITINHQEVRSDWYHVPFVGFKNRFIRRGHRTIIESGIAKIRNVKSFK